ncbi:hypothetical protein [Vibrio parahaemolyticus]|uniref:hypothetical protein n=1 Tax=Vibrio parahaemolyticus TaxID=670 RepID=UPI003D817AC2
MHPLQNGSQVTERPANKPVSGLPGYFTESGENNVPSYPGADWFNHVIDEFKNALSIQGVTFEPESDTNLAAAFSSVYVKSGVDFSAVSELISTDLELKVGIFVRTFYFNAPVLTTWQIVSSGAGDLTDGTVALDNGLYAKIFDSGCISVRSYGAYGDGQEGGGGNDDTQAWINVINNHSSVCGHLDDIYVLTSPVTRTKSGCSVYMNGSKVIWRGIAPSPSIIDRDRGVFEFKGTVGSIVETLQLTSDLKEFTQEYPITNASLVSGQRFIRVGSGSLPDAAFNLITVPKSGMVGSSILLDYINGWDIEPGNFITYQFVDVIEDCFISDFELIDETSSAEESDDISGVVFQYAHNCHANMVKGKYTNNPLVFGHFCHSCSASSGYLRDPKKPNEGGKGYVVQWNNSLYCLSSELRGIGVRHVNDFTQSAYCVVLNSGATDDKGAFITHGSYEHDLVYYNVKGTVTFANSGASFGDSSKRIYLERGEGLSHSALLYGTHFYQV